MADNRRKYSCAFILKPEQVAKAVEICDAVCEIFEEEDTEYGNWTGAEFDGIWFESDESGNPDAVIAMVSELMRAFPDAYPDGWSFGWADVCSKPRLDEFGGGAWACQVVDGELLEISLDAQEEARRQVTVWADEKANPQARLRADFEYMCKELGCETLMLWMKEWERGIV